jgi:hypothetical protein
LKMHIAAPSDKNVESGSWHKVQAPGRTLRKWYSKSSFVACYCPAAACGLFNSTTYASLNLSRAEVDSKQDEAEIKYYSSGIFC